MTTETSAPTDYAIAVATADVIALGHEIERERARIVAAVPGPPELVPAGKRLVSTGVVTRCCSSHRGHAACCDLHDCAPCCPDCPTCPTLRRARGIKVHPYRRLRITGHPLATGRKQAVYVHRLVLWDALGGSDSPCAWCGTPVRWFATGNERLIPDHVNGDTLDNRPENLVPACYSCNVIRAMDPRLRTHCAFDHPRTPENTYIAPSGVRQCVPCRREREYVRYWARRGVTVYTVHDVGTPSGVITPYE